MYEVKAQQQLGNSHSGHFDAQSLLPWGRAWQKINTSLWVWFLLCSSWNEELPHPVGALVAIGNRQLAEGLPAVTLDTVSAALDAAKAPHVRHCWGES